MRNKIERKKVHGGKSNKTLIYKEEELFSMKMTSPGFLKLNLVTFIVAINK